MVSCVRATRGLRRPSPGPMARLGVPLGGRVRTLRAVRGFSQALLFRMSGVDEDEDEDRQGAARCPSCSRNAHILIVLL